ncbi:MAG: Hsp20/alpha crystallin family protein [Deltaproteobacteria bacterium]|nr:Hsp20/alpha crystallin family protein [Deltaproteobacteria bacterium]RLA89993.1 MAG: Hsp20/alpha crystallin family protein [Deltaproteobacteria bacterium]
MANQSDDFFDRIKKFHLKMEQDFLDMCARVSSLRLSPTKVWQPFTDLFETESAYVIRMELAGMKKGDFTVTIEKNELIVKGVRMEPPLNEPRKYHQMEISFDPFERIILLPSNISAESVKAEYEDGFLTITISKKVKPKGKVKIEIE